MDTASNKEANGQMEIWVVGIRFKKKVKTYAVEAETYEEAVRIARQKVMRDNPRSGK